VLVGFLVLGLWGDVAVGGLIIGIELLASGAALTARKARACARNAFARNPAPHRHSILTTTVASEGDER
jgi:hypothetical protein